MPDEQPLTERRCVPCEGGTPPLGADRIAELLGQVEGWALQQTGEHDELVKTFRFGNFVEAVQFVDRITPVAEEEGHHPDLAVGYGRVEVHLWTHAAGGLTDNDFILAAKIDAKAGA